VAVRQEADVHGVSTRKVADLARRLGLEKTDKSVVPPLSMPGYWPQRPIQLGGSLPVVGRHLRQGA